MPIPDYVFEAIILSNGIHADLLLMDEAKGRDVAEQIGLRIMRTIGLLMSFYQSGISFIKRSLCMGLYLPYCPVNRQGGMWNVVVS